MLHKDSALNFLPCRMNAMEGGAVAQWGERTHVYYVIMKLRRSIKVSIKLSPHVMRIMRIFHFEIKCDLFLRKRLQ